MGHDRTISTVVVVAGLIALACLALGGVLMVQQGPESTSRLALFFGVIGTGVATLAALLKADQAARQTNGSLDARIEDTVHRAMRGRRQDDAPVGGPEDARDG